jgi:hypothetical protein
MVSFLAWTFTLNPNQNHTILHVRSRKLLDQYKTGTLPPGTTTEQLWTASKIKTSAIHPDTNEEILPPFRMCGYAVFGSPIIVGMLTTRTTLGTVFFQSLNQVCSCNKREAQPLTVCRRAITRGSTLATAMRLAPSRPRPSCKASDCRGWGCSRDRHTLTCKIQGMLRPWPRRWHWPSG